MTKILNYLKSFFKKRTGYYVKIENSGASTAMNMLDYFMSPEEREELKNLPNLEQVVLDELVAEFKEQHNEQMNAILYKYFTRNRPMNFIEKLEAGRYWFWECLLEWIWCMTHPEDTGGDFFCHICSDYCAYEEEMYYEKT